MCELKRELEHGLDGSAVTAMETLDLDRNVGSAAITTFIVLMAEEETRIRNDPHARPASLLREVFAE